MKKILLIVLCSSGLGVGAAQNREARGLLEQRFSDTMGRDASVQLLTVSRYVPVLMLRGMGTWSSPQSSVSIDGIPFEGFPLNRVTPDYVPLDLITAEAQIIPRTTVFPMTSMPGGGVDIRRLAIADSFVVVARAFGGAETGDPVLEKYTKGDLDLYNKNKIGYSGAAVLSNRKDVLAYRFSGGIFGYFTAGYAGRDAVLLAYNGRALLGRQNRNYLGSLELEYETDDGTVVSFQGGINGIIGWEQMPFLPVLGFFEGFTNTARVSAKNLPGGFSLHARRDGTSLSMRRQLGTEEGQYSSAVYSLHPVWSATLADGLTLFASGEIDRTTAAEDGRFFATDRGTTSLATSLGFEFHWSDDLTIAGTGRYDRSLEKWDEFSGEASVRIRPARNHEVTARISSVSLFPNLLELYGSFMTIRDRVSPVRVDTFAISGNPDLVPGRVNSASLRYESLLHEQQFFAESFLIEQERIIDRGVSNVTRTAWPGDYLFSGRYLNAPRRLLWGVGLGGTVNVARGAVLTAQYQFIESKTVRTVPRHTLSLIQEITLVPGTLVSFLVHGAGKTFWKEFMIPPQNDDSGGGGSDGVVSEHWSVDLSVEQELGDLWVGRRMRARIEIQNLFNRRVQRIPIGISFDTAVIGYVSFML